MASAGRSQCLGCRGETARQFSQGASIITHPQHCLRMPEALDLHFVYAGSFAAFRMDWPFRRNLEHRDYFLVRVKRV